MILEMLSYKNLTIIGTSHIAIESVKEVRKVIEELKPVVVALELDQERFFALVHKRTERISIRAIKEIGVRGFLFSLIVAWLERKLGKMVGVAPGTEMLVAFKTAIKQHAQIALIDRDVRITIRNLFKYLTLKEELRFIADMFAGLFFRKNVSFDLTKVPEEKLIRKMLSLVKKRYPSLHKALIEERNAFMAKNLYNLMNRYEDRAIVAVVGAGHEKEIVDIIKRQYKR